MNRATWIATRRSRLRRWLDRQDVAVSTLQVAAFLGICAEATRIQLRKAGAVVAVREARSLWWVAPERWP